MKKMTVEEFVNDYMQYGTKLMMVKSWRPEIEEATVYRKSVMIAENIYYASTDYDVQWFGERFDKSDMEDTFPYISILEWNYDNDTWDDITEQVETYILYEQRADTWEEFVNPTTR